VLFATQLIGAVLSETKVAPTITNTTNVIYGRYLGDDGSCLLKEVDYRIQDQLAKERAKDAILFLKGTVRDIRDSTGCSDNSTPQRCVESMKSLTTYPKWEELRNHMKRNRYKHFDLAFKEDSFDDPALYEPFVLYGQLELLLNSILYNVCGKNGTFSSQCDWNEIRENKNSFKSAYKFFLRVGTDLYGYRTMSRFNDKSGGRVARKMKVAGDKILRPMIIKWIDRLKDPNFRSIMNITGSEKTWRTNPEKYLEDKQFWAKNFKIYYPFYRTSEGSSSFVPVPIRSKDWISLRCSRYTKSYFNCGSPGNPGASCVEWNILGGVDSWLSCAGDTKGRDFDDYCKFRACPHIMAGQKAGSCNSELFQIQSIYADKPIKSGQKVGLRYESNYWLSRYKGEVDEGYGMNMPCPNKVFDPSDLTSCGSEVWSISKTNGKNNEIIRHGDLVTIRELGTCFIFKKM